MKQNIIKLDLVERRANGTTFMKLAYEKSSKINCTLEGK